MSEIHKFSILYDMDEDRLAWDTEDTAGATTRLWLTQRLSRGLIHALIPMLQQATTPDAPPQHEAVLQSWEQAAAMADFGKVPAVQPQPGAAAGLIKAAQITPTATGMDIVFERGDGKTLAVGVTHAALRQTLTVLYRLNVAAGWPLDLWPAWITQPTIPAPADAVN